MAKKPLVEGDKILKRMLQTPHMPHVTGKKSLTESLKKKGDAPIAKKKRRPKSNKS